MKKNVGIKAIGLSFPSIRRSNDYFKEKYPQLFEKAEEKGLAKFFSLGESAPSNIFEEEMQPYLSDPFRGTVDRWVLAQGESSLTLEYQAACDVLAAAQTTADEVDLMVVASIWPEQIIFGDATFLANRLGLKGAAWNINGGTGSTPVALQAAHALVQTGQYHQVLVVISCTYTRFFDETDTIIWHTSDGAGAFLISSMESNQGILGTKVMHTGIMDVVSAKPVNDSHGNPQVRIQISNEANQYANILAEEFLKTCCEEAAEASGVSLGEIDFFIFHTYCAWFANFGARILGISPHKTINLYSHYGNCGAVLNVANLYYAAQLEKIKENDLVLVYGMGGAGVAAANVMRWGKVALGSNPLPDIKI
ncbi:3-oxoacyl-(acyl-carrier-protein) synthase III [Rivularia sp. PCC 7116]|uniref:3-oxoacyl-ACP synthase III family protein n=1 Tax=Rivularia sp. PCC 7116 TaxID=373994 RepID=UPI00029ED063|nr:3-oxoacyl-(acyl-carrier-protein) synthase III [Rivularia sp. PCC 7116]